MMLGDAQGALGKFFASIAAVTSYDRSSVMTYSACGEPVAGGLSSLDEEGSRLRYPRR